MSKDTVEIDVLVTTEEARAELEDFENKVDEVASVWQRAKYTIEHESRHIMRSLGGIVSMIQNIFATYGYSLGTLGDALLSMIGSVIQSVIAMQYAYAAGGPIGWAMMAVAGTSLMFALHAEAYATINMEDAKRSMAQANATIHNLTTILRPWRF